jgi:hypothetical protein
VKDNLGEDGVDLLNVIHFVDDDVFKTEFLEGGFLIEG